MALTGKQRQARKKYLGATDIPALLGVDPYKTLYQIWLEKTGQYERPESDNPSLTAGRHMEDAVLNWAAEHHLGKLSRKGLERRVKGYPIVVHLDAQTQAGVPVEAKTAGLHGPLTEFYGEPLTDQVPERVIIQAQMQMAATEAFMCYVPVFVGGRGFVMYVVNRDQELINLCLDKAYNFWTKHVIPRIPPNEPIPVKLARYVPREEGKAVDIPQNLIDEWLTAKAEVAYAEEHEETAKEKIHKILAEAGAEVGNADGGTLTYYATVSNRIDTKALKAEMPDVAEKYNTKSTSRTLRWKPLKK
jgi:putative phage-type endonuclease